MNYGAIVIGAHTGEFLKEKLSSYINKKNILIEPVFHNHNKLRENFTHFTDTQFLDCAISNIDEIKKFYLIFRCELPVYLERGLINLLLENCSMI